MNEDNRIKKIDDDIELWQSTIANNNRTILLLENENEKLLNSIKAARIVRNQFKKPDEKLVEAYKMTFEERTKYWKDRICKKNKKKELQNEETK